MTTQGGGGYRKSGKRRAIDFDGAYIRLRDSTQRRIEL